MLQAPAREARIAPLPLPKLDRVCAIGFPLLAALLFVLSTRHGIGILPDSTRYMGLAAQPWDAPAYPFLLQTVAASGADIAAGAWYIGLVLSALNAFLVWTILREVTARSGYAAVGTALVVIAPQTVALQAVAMSEPLFITTILLTLIGLLRYLRSDDRRWLLAVGLGIGLASLVRFTGPPLGAAIALFLLIDPRHAVWRRLGDVVRIVLPSGLLFLAWMTFSEWLVGRSTGRPLEWYGNTTAEDWLNGFHSLTAWIFPVGVPFAIRAPLFVTAIAASLILLGRHAGHVLEKAREGKTDPALIVIPLAFFLFAYLAFFVLATSIEANLSLNSRYAYPLYCAAVLTATIVLARVQIQAGWTRQLHGALVALAVVMLAGHAVRTADRTRQAYLEGLGYASLEWTQSPTLAAVRQLPPDAVLYSNGPDAIGYVLRRKARNIPAHILLRTGREDPAFPYTAQLADARATLARGNAYVVFLKGIDWRFYMASEAELVQRLNLRLVTRQADGSIYRGGGTTPAIAGK